MLLLFVEQLVHIIDLLLVGVDVVVRQVVEPLICIILGGEGPLCLCQLSVLLVQHVFVFSQLPDLIILLVGVSKSLPVLGGQAWLPTSSTRRCFFKLLRFVLGSNVVLLEL